MKKINLFLLVLLTVMVGSCVTPQLGYFQDVEGDTVTQLPAPSFVKIQKGDKLSILVSSKNPDLAYLFNLPVVGHYQSSTSGKGLATSSVSNYTVNQNGEIDFPVLGKIKIEGMTRSEVAAEIKDRLTNGDMLRDAVVTVDFLDMYYGVIGEVRRPGRYIIDHDQTTLLDALSNAGDLTIDGRRDNVLVMREENGSQKTYRLDLSNAAQLYKSPAFYLKQNDIIYIQPTDKKARESTSTGNAMMQPSLWISIASLLTTISVLVFK